MLTFDIQLTPEEQAQLADTDAGDWFTRIGFANAESPTHPMADSLLEANNALKQELVGEWVERVAPGRRVLDLFAANGAFSFLAANAGAREVVGVDFEQGRVDVASLTAELLRRHGALPCPMRFERGDVYETTRRFSEPFDVVLNLGGLYHIADPPYVLDQARAVTAEWMILQTDSVLPGRDNHARFAVRQDQTERGLASVRGGRGVWHYTVASLHEFCSHAGLEIVEERQPARRLRRRFPWWCALARPVGGPSPEPAAVAPPSR
jgi:16S rRNA G966 N2-methylase RsmD